MKLPRDIGPIHFVGIGGIGMSGLAEVLANLGYQVQGSDVADSANVRRLRDKGIDVAIGHDARNLDGADVVVVSSAVKRDNPELKAARAQRLPVVRRAEMLAELMRLKRCIAIAGTHGKTTTTSLVAALTDAGGFDPTVINGGIINAYGTNARLGEGDWMVVEADELDGTFLRLPADIAIVTNVDPEHLDHFKTFDAVQEAFRAFVENVPFYGFAVMCTDHPVVQTLVGRIEDRRIITYGENPQADVRLTDLVHANGQSRFSVVFRDRAGETAHEIKELRLPMPGRHNALNATAAIAVARELGIADDLIRKALAGFAGVKRRFTRTGEWNGIPIIDDYGHHPIEIAAVLRAAREFDGRPGARDRATAPLYPPGRAVRIILQLLQRRRYRHGRAGLSGRRSADRGCRPRRSGAGAACPRAPPGDPARGVQGHRRDGAAARPFRRYRGVSRRRLHHPMGLRAARRAGGARPGGVMPPRPPQAPVRSPRFGRRAIASVIACDETAALSGTPPPARGRSDRVAIRVGVSPQTPNLLGSRTPTRRLSPSSGRPKAGPVGRHPPPCRGWEEAPPCQTTTFNCFRGECGARPSGGRSP